MSGKSQLTPIIIVSYRTPDDVAACLFSLDALQPESAVSAHICENGGAAEWENLNTALLQPNGPCLADNEIPISLKHDFRRVARLRLRRSGRIVLVGEAKKNLGYAGGINAWLVPLILTADWTGCWFLNPDTRVAPDALARLIRHAARRNLGMVGSRIMATPAATHVSTKGLHWRKTIAKTKAIGQNTSACAESDSKAIEALLDAPSGASCYLTRSCAEALAPLDERYFLYFEDLDWGIRAKRAGYRLGYAHDSVVYHVGGTSTGGDLTSPLGIYLSFRNSLLFVKTHYPYWLVWTALMGLVHAVRLWSREGFALALRGLLAGLRAETGSPHKILDRHILPEGRPETEAFKSTL